MLKWALIVAGICGGLLVLTIIVVAVSGGGANTTTNPDVVPTLAHASDGYVGVPGEVTPGNGVVMGRLCESTPGSVDQMIIVAEKIPSRVGTEKFYPGIAKAGTDSFYFDLEPGIYEFYTKRLDGARWGLYSEYVQCGMTSVCVDHKMLQVNLFANQQVSNIDICDYAWVNGI